MSPGTVHHVDDRSDDLAAPRVAAEQRSGSRAAAARRMMLDVMPLDARQGSRVPRIDRPREVAALPQLQDRPRLATHQPAVGGHSCSSTGYVSESRHSSFVKTWSRIRPSYCMPRCAATRCDSTLSGPLAATTLCGPSAPNAKSIVIRDPSVA